MTSFEFQSMLYRTRREMLDAIAEEWVGTLVPDERQKAFEVNDTSLAAECIEGWGLDEDPDAHYSDEPRPSHMTKHGYDADDLAKAFGRLRG